MSPPELQDRIAAIDYWYHRIELPDGVSTPGWAPLDAEIYNIPDRLDGKRVLDVGAWDGYWTFEALNRGAAEVVAIDDFSDHLGIHVARKAWDTFDLCRDAFGYTDNICKRFDMSVYEVTPEKLGRFDIVFFFGALYHLRHPLLGLDKLSAVCNQQIYVESAILDDYSPYLIGHEEGYPGQQMVMEFYPTIQYGGNESNWWVPTLTCLANMVVAAGFDHVKSWKLKDGPTEPSECRGFVVGTKA